MDDGSDGPRIPGCVRRQDNGTGRLGIVMIQSLQKRFKFGEG